MWKEIIANAAKKAALVEYPHHKREFEPALAADVEV
jgi:hypothetical protein